MRKKLQIIAAAMLAFALPQFVLAQNLNKHIDNAENASIDYLTSDEYILSGNTFPNTIAGMNNTGGFGGPLSRIQLEKLDNNLNNQWFKTYCTVDEVNAVLSGTCPHLDAYFTCGDAKQTSDGGYIICGRVRRDGETSGCSGATYDHLFLLKTDGAGNPQWYKRYDVYGMLVSVVEMPGGGYVACGYTGELGMTDVALVIGTDAGGNLQWSRNGITPAFWDHVTPISSAYYEVIPFSGNFALVGIEDYKGTVWGSTLVSVIDAMGNFISNFIVDNENYGYTLVGRAIADSHDGDVVITGMGGQPCLNGAQIMLLKLDPMTTTIQYHKVYSYANIGDDSWGDAIKVIGNTISFAGTDMTNGGAVYAEADRTTGNLLRYTVFNAGDAYDAKCMTVNTALNVPVYSGTYFPSSEPTFVVRNSLNWDCANDMYMPEFSPPYDVYDALYQDPGVRDIKDAVYAYDIIPVENVVCGGGPVVPAVKKQQIGGIATANKFGVSPNPANDYIDITFNNDHFAGGNIKVYNTLGQAVLTRQLTTETDVPYRLDISGLQNGVYVIDAEWNNGSRERINIVKQ